jgi:NAD(P)-dependent dehydrogenase (short-subunit alcohol dehydrogenase family)
MPARKTSEPCTGRVALTTGAAHGIGQAIAAGLAERGTRIVLGDIDEVSAASDLIGATGHPIHGARRRDPAEPVQVFAGAWRDHACARP